MRISYEGKHLGDFGDSEFQGMLAARLEQQAVLQLTAARARLGLGSLVILLFVGLVLERLLEGRRANQSDLLKDRMDLRSIPTQSISKMIWDDFFREKQIKRNEKVLQRHAPIVAKVLRPNEKIRHFTIGQRIPDGRESALRGGFLIDSFLMVITAMMKIDTVLLVLTDRRILILQIDLFGSRLRSIREGSYQGIRRVATDRPSRIILMMNRYGAGFLTLEYSGKGGTKSFHIPRSGQADQMKKEIEERIGGSHSDFVGVRGICVECNSSIPDAQSTCPICHRAVRSPWRTARLSLFYPGLGQLKNQTLLKGVVFLSLGTYFLFRLAVQLLIAWQGTAEVDPNHTALLLMMVIATWISSAADAYYSAR